MNHFSGTPPTINQQQQQPTVGVPVGYHQVQSGQQNSVSKCLFTGQQLNRGQSLASPSGEYRLVHQDDGNVVLYRGSQALWATNTCGRATTHFIMQHDGNLVLYNGGHELVWASDTYCTDAGYFVVQDDGNIVVYSNESRIIWERQCQLPGASPPTINQQQQHQQPAVGVPVGYHQVQSGQQNSVSKCLFTGQQLNRGQSLASPSGEYRLVHQDDGNVVLYRGSQALWATNTCGRATTHFIMQHDGNLVLYNGPEPLWASNTCGTDATHLVVQDDGNIVVYSNQLRALWSRSGGLARQHQFLSHSGDRLPRGLALGRGCNLASPSGEYRLVHQDDGNVVLYRGSQALWATNTCGRATTHFIMQHDGNLVLYNGPEPLWASNTCGTDATHLVVQDDGNIVVYSNQLRALWSRFGVGFPHGLRQ